MGPLDQQEFGPNKLDKVWTGPLRKPDGRVNSIGSERRPPSLIRSEPRLSPSVIYIPDNINGFRRRTQIILRRKHFEKLNEKSPPCALIF